MPKKTYLIFLPVLVIFGFFVLYLISHFYPQLLWFKSFGYDTLWWFVLKAKLKTFSFFFLTAYVFLRINIWIALRICKKANTHPEATVFRPPFEFLNTLFQRYIDMKQENPFFTMSQKAYSFILQGTIIVFSFILGMIAKNWWHEIYAYINQQPFNLQDPVFYKEIAFYFFSLPLLDNIKDWLGLLLFFTIALTGWIYFTKNILAYLFTYTKNSNIKIHIFSLASGFLLLFAFGVQLKMYNLLYSAKGSVFGAAFTDVKAHLLGLKILFIVLIIEAVLIFIWGFRANLKVPVYFLGVIFVLWLVFGKIYPGIIQNYVVAPNEIQKEEPYIKRSIKFTRLAYNLDKVEEIEYPATKNLTQKDIQNSFNILDNIRLWNPEPLKATFKQLQEIRLYYEFNHIDIDRYLVDGKLQQVMLSPRELDTTQLTAQAQTWVNKHLIYTHGYGVCLSPVNKITPEGLPVFLVKDLPPVSAMGFDIKRPEIYFGEKTENYIIANTSQPEFNYPKGETNEHNKYDGAGGIQLDSFLKKLIFAFKFSDIKILISGYTTPKSRLLYDREIKTIIGKITPFLVFDRDPYLVLTPNGRMVWLIDGYTISKKFPYSEPYRGLINYIRNSVLVSIDAYSGEVHYYIKDAKDPVIQTYARIYPDLFEPFDQLPPELLEHIRYPKDLFVIQSEMYSTYHMTNPQVFYNREDLWAIPKETYGEQEKIMAPYYTVLKVANEPKESYNLILPFTPTNKNNMIAWLNAKCDPEEFGQLKVFKFPKERTIFGPMQIESRIDQDTSISQKLTLWGQVGSRVIRGNLMVIPLEDSLIYVEPIYLQATQGKLPELKRVILAYKNNIVMKPTLEEAVSALLGGRIDMPDKEREAETDIDRKIMSKRLKSILKKLVSEYHNFKESSKQNDWTGFGESLDNIDKLIENIKKYEE